MSKLNNKIAKARQNFDGSMSEFNRVESRMLMRHAFKIVFFALAVVGIVAVLSGKCQAQITETRPAKSGIKWNNHKYFESRPKAALLNWGDYIESVDGKTLATWALFAGAGIMHGSREAYHAQPTVFETAWGVSETSFWGSDAWERNYIDNDPDQPHKHEYFGNVGRDIWHTAGFGSKAFIFTGTFAIGCRKQPIKYRAANALIGYGVQSVFASFTYQVLR